MKVLFLILNIFLINLSFAEIRIDSDNRVAFDSGSILKIERSGIDSLINLNSSYLGQHELEQLIQDQSTQRLSVEKPRFILIDIEMVEEIKIKQGARDRYAEEDF